jgi:hypothetical protein
MNTAIKTPISPTLMAELQQAADTAAQNVHDPIARRKARERMDRMREMNRLRFGVQEIGVDIIREMRDGR